MPSASTKNFDLARSTALDLSERVRREEAQVRNDFIVSPVASEPPAMTRIMRGGRGGGVVKLKTLLSMLWVAVAPPFDVTEPARVWAQLIGLEDPEGNGAARVNAAIRTLEEGRFLRVERKPGMPSRVFLMNETGNGEPYTKPSDYWLPGGARPDGPDTRPLYTRIPSEFWTNGWITQLSAPAVAMFLALLHQSRGGSRQEIWFSPAVADRRYGLTNATRSKGVRELESLGLVEIDRMVIGRESIGNIRARNTYTLNLLRLQIVPTLPRSAAD